MRRWIAGFLFISLAAWFVPVRAATFYDLYGCTGHSMTIEPGEYECDLKTMGNGAWNESVWSVKLAHGEHVYLCQDHEFKKECRFIRNTYGAVVCFNTELPEGKVSSLAVGNKKKSSYRTERACQEKRKPDMPRIDR